MKKKLEAELISIAHRILKIRDKSDIEILHKEARKLYETLSVLRFAEENFEGARPTIDKADIEEKLEMAFDKDDTMAADDNSGEILKSEPVTEEPVLLPESSITTETEAGEMEAATEMKSAPSEPEQENTQTEIAEEEEESADTSEEEEIPAEEEIEERPKKEVFIPSFELSFEAKEPEEQEVPKPTKPQFTFDDLLGKDYVDPVFIKPEEVAKQPVNQEQEVAPVRSEPSEVNPSPKKDKRPSSLNDRLSKGITIGLNDRIAFMKHLFGNSSEDYNRVLSQLITFDTFEEAQTFIDEMVKPDYDNWQGKDEYSQRFMEIIERRFA